jgi:hypothetical protein
MNELRAGGVQTTRQLSQRVHSKYSDVDFDMEDLRVEIKKLMDNGFVESVEPILTEFGEYLRSWRYGFRLWAFLGATIFVFPIVEFLQASFPLAVVRWAAATFLVLFAPGFALVWVLFPSRWRMSGLNRLALTIAMSLFMVPAIGLVLNYTPVEIEPQPIAAILTLLTIGLLFVGAYREFLTMRAA